MGLDVTVFQIDKKNVINDMHYEKNSDSSRSVSEKTEPSLTLEREFPPQGKDIFHWRNNWEIERWLHGLYFRKGGRGTMNTGGIVRIEETDLDYLKKTITEEVIDEGRIWISNEYNNQGFLSIAGNALKNGYALYGEASW